MNHLSNVTKQKTKTKFSWFPDLGLFWLEPISKWKNLKYKNYTRFTKRDHMQKKKSSLIKSRFTLKTNCFGWMQAENFYITPPEGNSFILFFFPLSPLLSFIWFALAHECEKIHFQMKACHCLYLALWPTPLLSWRSWELRVMWRCQKMEANSEFWKFLERHPCPQQVLCESEKDFFFS